MTFRFGFELEGFFVGEDNLVTLPPKNYPCDGFPGLCEVRTVGGKSLQDAYFELLNEYRKFPFDYKRNEHIFSPEQKRLLRKRGTNKEAMDLSNLYGKEPKHLGNRTLASLQINISNLVKTSYDRVIDGKISRDSDQYGLFDLAPIIRKLDQEFAKEIKDSKRQPGFYAIKDGIRVEYRSLPNWVFKTDLNDITVLLDRIKKCVKDA